jgi:cytochrome b561
LPDSIARLQQIASHAVHGLIYALLFAVPISGWLMSSAKGFKTVWFGIIPLPDLIAKDKELGKLLEFVHQSLNYFLLLLVVLHIAALIKHRFIDRDDVLTRMLPGGKKA